MDALETQELGFKKYSEIENLHKVLDYIMASTEVVALEKLDGTNIRFGAVGGAIRVGGRNEEFPDGSSPGTGMGFYGWFTKNARLGEALKDLSVHYPAVIFYGEWFGPGVPINRHIVYGTEKGFRLFDVRVNGEFVSWDGVLEFGERAGLKVVPELYRGKPSLEVFDSLRALPTTVGRENGIADPKNIGEGIVIKPTMTMRDSRGNRVIAKHKTGEHAERKSLASGKVMPENPADAVAYVEEFVTRERLTHILQSLRERNIDVSSMKAMGDVIRGMAGDILHKEGKAELARLDEASQKLIGKLLPDATKKLFVAYLQGA